MRLKSLFVLAGTVLALIAAIGLSSGLPVVASSVLPQLPQAYLNTTYPAQSGNTIRVGAGGDLQGAINTAQPGDTILLAAGATFTGNFILPAKTNTGKWVVIQSDTTNLPAPGTRVSPSNAGSMAKLVSSTNGDGVLATAPNANHYWISGIEMTLASNVTVNYGMVLLGDGSTAQNSLSQVPTDLVLDRDYIHGNSAGAISRCVALNSARSAVIDSYVSACHINGFDAQAIGGWNGPGPYKIVNNYLEGSGENIMFGGADPAIANLVPSDIEIRHNYIAKPLSWFPNDPSYAGQAWSIKNLLELKNAQRVLVDGNVFENNWAGAQNGYAFLFRSWESNGRAPWTVVQDVTFQNNIVRHTAAVFNIAQGGGDAAPVQYVPTNRIAITNNFLDDVNGPAWGGGDGAFLQIGTTDNVSINHTTAFTTGSIIRAAGPASNGFTFQNTIVTHNQYGVGGDNTYGSPSATISTYFPGIAWGQNALIGTPSSMQSQYPSGTFFPADTASVGFVNAVGGNYALAASSPYKGKGTDGTDLGADFSRLGFEVAVKQGINSGATATTPPAQISLTKKVDKSTAVNGDSLTYTITATNTSQAIATNVRISDLLPGQTSFVSATGGGSLNGNSVVWSIGSLVPGQSQSVSFTVRVN